MYEIYMPKDHRVPTADGGSILYSGPYARQNLLSGNFLAYVHIKDSTGRTTATTLAMSVEEVVNWIYRQVKGGK